MVIGNGMVAKRFESYKANDDFIIFASGVSNSKNTDSAGYNRETDLLINIIEKNKNKTLVYFSTCSLYDPEESASPYVLHKRKIEDFIQKNVANYYIFRVSNLVGKSSNPNTILNFFYYHMTNRINFDLWSNSSRNLIDKDDMYRIVDHLLKNGMYKNQIINIANPESYSVKEIITALETTLGTIANYISISKGSRFSIDISLILPVIRELKIDFSEFYLPHLIKKYYLH
jgi:nucleoside-diphosphate-sugar epimerase